MTQAAEEAFEDPVRQFDRRYRAEHAQAVAACFKDLLKRSGVNVAENRKTVAWLKAAWARLKRLRNRRCWLSIAFLLCVVLVIVGLGAAILRFGNLSPDLPVPPDWAGIAGIVAVPVGIALAVILYRGGKTLDARIAETESEATELQARAEAQMAPLNHLFDWEQPTALLHKVIPIIEPDAYFTQGRAEELAAEFGWNPDAGDDNSVRCVQSGEINGNPYLLASFRHQDWGDKTYTGSLVITWTERVSDGKGRSRLVTRVQTLVASVVKPVPVYTESTRLIYANDAAPELRFSRTPTDYAGERPGLFARFRRWRTKRKLMAFSRNLKDESQFTLMADTAFETLFRTPNRSNERAFRLLFTPLAQRRMTALLNDGKVGFGDDFVFRKEGRINVIAARHLEGIPPLIDPDLIRHWDIDTVHQRFVAFHTQYFRALYFAFAPLLLIPLYRQLRSTRTAFEAVTRRAPAAWEREAIADGYARACFGGSGFDSELILKTGFTPDHGGKGGGTIEVTAHGFRTVPRVDYVPRRGGDGDIHMVPVPWDEYLPHADSAEIHVIPTPDPSKPVSADDAEMWCGNVEEDGAVRGSARCRRRLITYLR